MSTLNSSQFWCLDTKAKLISIHWNQVIFDRHKETKSIPISQLKSSQVRSPTSKPSEFNPISEIQSNSIPTLISNRFRRPDTKTDLISIHTLEASNFRPPHKNQANSDIDTETKSIPIPHIEIKLISTTHTTTKPI